MTKAEQYAEVLAGARILAAAAACCLGDLLEATRRMRDINLQLNKGQ